MPEKMDCEDSSNTEDAFILIKSAECAASVLEPAERSNVVHCDVTGHHDGSFKIYWDSDESILMWNQRAAAVIYSSNRVRHSCTRFQCTALFSCIAKPSQAKPIIMDVYQFMSIPSLAIKSPTSLVVRAQLYLVIMFPYWMSSCDI